MKVVMGADAWGFDLKEFIKKDLLSRGYEILDVSPDSPVLYQDAAKGVARAIQKKEADRGIAICGTGMGVSIVANKHRGVYAALCESVFTARRSKTVNNTNVLCLGGMVLGCVMGAEMARAWLEAKHLDGLSPDMLKSVAKESDELVKCEEECY